MYICVYIYIYVNITYIFQDIYHIYVYNSIYMINQPFEVPMVDLSRITARRLVVDVVVGQQQLAELGQTREVLRRPCLRVSGS